MSFTLRQIRINGNFNPRRRAQPKGLSLNLFIVSLNDTFQAKIITSESNL